MKLSTKLLSLLVALLMTLSLFAGCNSTEEEPLPPSDDQSQAPSDEKDPVEEPEVFEGINIDGVPLSKYVIVTPARGDIYTKYAAQNLADHLSSVLGIELTINNDRSAESKYEILIGATSRAASTVDCVMADEEFVLYKADTKIVCLGNDYMVGGGIGKLISILPKKASDVNITSIPSEPTPELFVVKEAKSAILMIGDGMGFNSIEMAYPRFTEAFAATFLPVQGEIKTASLNTLSNPNSPTDSAAAGTALATGYKTHNGKLGLDEKGESIQNIRELAYSTGAKTGVITTDAITGATPAAFLVHHSSRNDTDVIQSQINVLKRKHALDVAYGSLTNDLTSATADALYQLSADESSFFLMVEAAYIDKHSHSNLTSECINTVKRFHDVIAYAIEFVLCHPDTVIIVTADHETGGIRKNADGTFTYTSTNHTTANVPIFALGEGTEIFHHKRSDNTSIPKFIATIFGNNNFGTKFVY